MKRFADWYMTSKLLFVNGLLFILMVGVLAVVFLSFQNIDAKISDMMTSNFSVVVKNAEIGRHLNTLFSQINRIVYVVNQSNEGTDAAQEMLLQSAGALRTEIGDKNLLSAFDVYIENIKLTFAQKTVSRKSLKTYLSDLQEMRNRLLSLQERLEPMLLQLAAEGEDDAALEGFARDMPWHQSAVLQIRLLLESRLQEVSEGKLSKQPAMPSFYTASMLFEQMREKLTALQTAQTPIDKEIGDMLVFLTSIEADLPTFAEQLHILNRSLGEKQTAEEQLIAAMAARDAEMTATAEQTQQRMLHVARSSAAILFALFGIMLALMISGWLSMRWMLKPLRQLAMMANQLAGGDLDVHASVLERKASSDEIGMLSNAFRNLIRYFQEMAATATAISQGNLSHITRPKSQKDVLGRAFSDMSAYLNKIAAVATAIAAGDLRNEIAPQTEEDVLGTSFEQMRFLRLSLCEITSGALQLSTAAEELDRISSQMAVMSEETSEQTQSASSHSRRISENVELVAVAAEEMSANVREMALNTDKMAHVANTAVEKASLARGMMGNLERQSQEIGELSKLITRISQQTNLLALNASIEAARAGDSGRGFAVVAKEVKELSRETATSAEHIIHKLQTIQSSSKNAVAAISEVSAIITDIRNLASSTATGIEEQSISTNDIAGRMEDVSHGSQHIVKLIADVSTAAQHTTQGATDVQKAAKDLAHLADQLEALLAQFKI